MKRLSYIDWMRGLACLVMFQTHCYDSWLEPSLRESHFLKLSQLGGSLPAPLFLFLAGISSALATNRLREKGATRSAIARQSILRGLEIFALGVAFRVQEFFLGYRWSKWQDLFRVDILNLLGLSMVLMALLCWATGAGDAKSADRRGMFAGLFSAAATSLLAPLVWTSWRPRFLIWPLESYINGVHNLDVPQSGLFPVFPWCAFAFAGLAVGFLLFSDFARRRESQLFLGLGAAGVAACLLALLFDALPIRVYSAYDYWHTSPNFFLMRCGVLLLILFASYAWCRWGWANLSFSPVIQLGKTSLLVYWVHIEFVYGSFSIERKNGCTLDEATIGLLQIIVAMLLLSVARTGWKEQKFRALRPPSPSVTLPAT